MQKNWFFWPYGVFTGAENMAIDLALAREIDENMQLPIIRFYGWKNDTVSLGFSQPQHEIDLAKAEENGVDVVRRPTGGRAIYHSNELTYSIIYPKDSLKREVLYYRVNNWFQMLLARFNVPAKLQGEQPDFRQHYREGKSAICFSNSARYELKVSGKKILGSAQRVFNHAILQHGSLMIGNAHQQLVHYLNISDQEKNSFEALLKAGATELSSHLAKPPTPQAIADEICGILTGEGIELKPFEMISSARQVAQNYIDQVDLKNVELI